MLNEEKVKNMTTAAAYENGPEKKNIDVSSYFRTDYIGLQLVKSAVAYTVSFLIFTAIWAMGKMEELMLMLTRAEYLQNILRTLVILYAAGLVAYEIAIYAYYSWKYEDAKQSVKAFRFHLKNIHKFYETEESASKEEYDESELEDEENT